MTNKVLIVGFDNAISQMFLMNGWKITANPLETDIDLIQFTGGEDVSPALYGEQPHPATSSNPKRDMKEKALFVEFKGKVPMVGICRGAQFLNVMNGGSLWQHVTDHAIRMTHPAYDNVSGEEISVTSTHHQMMIPHNSGVVLMTAAWAKLKQGFDVTEVGNVTDDVEAVFYPETNCLCYQPHPEYVDLDHKCQTTYFDYLNNFFGL